MLLKLSFAFQEPESPCLLGFPTELNTLSDHIRAKRMVQHILQRELAEILDVSTDTVTNWEQKRSEPHYHHLPAITKFLGYALIKHHPMGGWRQTLLNDRLHRGLPRHRYAKLIGIDESTLMRAELGKNILRKSEKRILEFLSPVK